MPKAVGYIRVSTEKQLDNTSLEKQEIEIKRYCEEKGIILVDIYNEGAKSAASFEGRIQFQKMYQRVLLEESDIDYVIVYKQDRISRDPLDSAYILKRLNMAKKHLICIADNINTEDPKAQILFHVLSLVAQLEKEFISFRTTSGMEKRVEDGLYSGGRVFGYDFSNGKLVVNPEQARIVQYMFEKYAIDGWGYFKIMDDLNMQGIKTIKGNSWSINSVKTILENRLYIGEFKWKKQYRKGEHMPIIDLDLWEKAEAMRSIKSHTPEKIHPGSFPLSGLLKCPLCGSSMVQANANPKNKYYVCSKRKTTNKSACNSNLVKKETAETFVLNHVFSSLTNANLFNQILNTTKSNLQSEIKPLEENLLSYQKELDKNNESMQKVIALYDEGTINKKLLQERLGNLQNEEAELIKMFDYNKKQMELRNKDNLEELISRVIEDMEEFFYLLDDGEKKVFLKSFISEIHVFPDRKTKQQQIKEIIYSIDF
jgi:site-specific DNA recombinase